MFDLPFFQELIKILLQVITPTLVLILGGRWIIDRYDVVRKRREQEVELARFVRERQYEALQELYDLFGEFMRLYRKINSKETNLEDATVRAAVLAECERAEARVDAAILRIASEFTHDNRELLEGFLANLRQSVQLWRERVQDAKRLPFTHSDQVDYLRFKSAFSNTTTYLASQIYQGLEPAEVALDESKRLLVDIFSNKWERHGAHVD